MPIEEIFRDYGEAHFRKLEREVIAALPESDCVVATGGGCVQSAENAANLRHESLVFFLDVSPEVSYGRISESSRPALTDKDPVDEVKYLINLRYPAYLRSSDFRVDADGDAEKVADEIIRIISDVASPLSESDIASGVAEVGGAAVAGDAGDAGGEVSAGAVRYGEVMKSFSGVPMPEKKSDLLFSFVKKNPLGSICAIAGRPSGHSRTPYLFNTIFERYGIGAHCTYLEKETAGDVAGAVRSCGLRAISVTIPFKEDIIPYLDEINEDAAAIGAVNTVFNAGGRLYGSNTDWYGVMKPLVKSGIKVKSRKAVVIGAGGAARAAVYALMKLGADVTAVNRTVERAERLAADMNASLIDRGCLGTDGEPVKIPCKAGGIDKMREIMPDIIINATSIGMRAEDTPVDRENRVCLRKGVCVFDLVYTPPVTRLLFEAQSAGCTVISGVEMFVYQAAEQLFRYFGIRVDADEIRGILR